MTQYSENEITNALQVVSSTITNCEKMQLKFTKGNSQYSLLTNRIKAMYISKSLLTKESEITKYSKEELNDSLKPIISIINKCETGQKKHNAESSPFKRFQKIIDAMNICKTLILNEIETRI